MYFSSFLDTVELPWATTSHKRPPNQNPNWFLRQSNCYQLNFSMIIECTYQVYPFYRFANHHGATKCLQMWRDGPIREPIQCRVYLSINKLVFEKRNFVLTFKSDHEFLQPIFGQPFGHKRNNFSAKSLNIFTSLAFGYTMTTCTSGLVSNSPPLQWSKSQIPYSRGKGGYKMPRGVGVGVGGGDAEVTSQVDRCINHWYLQNKF